MAGQEEDGRAKEHVNGSARHHNETKHGDSSTKSPLMRSPFRALIQDFSPIWYVRCVSYGSDRVKLTMHVRFTWVMNSGILAILLHQHPYQFQGIHTLSTIAFLVALVLFIGFSICFILRLVIHRGTAFREITTDISQLTLTACWAIGYLTLIANVSLTVSNASWGGYWAMMLAYVMWWFGAFWTLTTLFFAFSILSRQHLAGGSGADASKNNTHSTPLPTLVIIPAVGVATVAVVGGEVAAYSAHMNARLAVPIIISAFPLLGLGMLLATLLYATLFRQLLESGFPPPPQITSLFVYIGPVGQSAAALQALGNAARLWFGEYNRGTFITMESASAFDAACGVGALLLLGPAVFFTVFSIYGVIDCAITTRKVRWTPSWNAVLFPTATMTTATTYFAVNMDSPTFRVLTSIQLVALVMVYFVNVAFTLTGIFKGELLIVREDPRVKKQMEEEQKER